MRQFRKPPKEKKNGADHILYYGRDRCGRRLRGGRFYNDAPAKSIERDDSVDCLGLPSHGNGTRDRSRHKTGSNTTRAIAKICEGVCWTTVPSQPARFARVAEAR